MGAHDFLINLALVLTVASLAAAACRALRQPVILGYLIAGMAVSPQLGLPWFADTEIVAMLSELGVILLMFCLGVEFSARKLARVAGRAGPTAAVEISFTAWLGFVAAQSLGWSTLTCVFAAAMAAISSTMVIARTFDEQNKSGPMTELVFGVLIFEDVVAIVAITVLTAVATGSEASSHVLADTLLQLGAFLLGAIFIAVPVVPRAVRRVARLDSNETTLVFCVGLCFAMAVLASLAGFSVALGAFIAGSLVAESGEAHRIEALVVPLRDLFSAIFFVSVGMLVTPAAIPANLSAIGLFVGVVLLGKLFGVTLGSLLSGNSVLQSVSAAVSLSQVGEFSFIIVGIGVTHGVIPADLMVVAVTVSAITTFATPWMVRAASAAARAVDRRLPRRVATMLTLYGAWLERLRLEPRVGSQWAAIRGTARRIVIDALCLLGIALGADVARQYAPDSVVVVAALVLAAPFLLALVRNCVHLATRMARETLPAASRDRADLAATPRRAFTVALQLAVLVVVGLPLLTVVQPFVPPWALFPILGLLLGAIAFLLWNGTRSLDGHVQAAAEVVVEALAASLPEPDDRLEAAERLLPGIGDVASLTLGDADWAVGRSLGEIDIHGWSGAIPVALWRGASGLPNPEASTRLETGDIIAVLGTSKATDAARALISAGPVEGKEEDPAAMPIAAE